MPSCFKNKRTDVKKEEIKLDISIGDIILVGRFKNKRIVVKTIGKDDLGQPTINGMSLLKMRIEKLLPLEKQSKETREEMEVMKMTIKEQVGSSFTREMALEYQRLEGIVQAIQDKDWDYLSKLNPRSFSSLYDWKNAVDNKLKRVNKLQNNIIRASGAKNLTEFDNLLRATLRNTTTRESKMITVTKSELKAMIQKAIVTEQSGSMPGEGMNQVSPMQAQVQSFTDVIYDDWHTFIMTVESKARKNNVSYQVLAATVEKLFNDEIGDY